MRILVSACLIGYNCKYNGSNNYNSRVVRYVKGHDVIAVCPEMLSGLSCPRIPCERFENKIVDKNGNDCTEQFIKGAKIAFDIAKENDIQLAILQKRSPSCGVSVIYDGTFTGQLTQRSGVFAEMLRSLKIPILEAESENVV